MSLEIIRDLCESGGNRAKIVIEGSGPEEVMSAAAKHMVLSHAASLGVSRPGIGTGGGPYPVTPEGNQNPGAMPTAGTPGQRYRYDWPVQGGL